MTGNKELKESLSYTENLLQGEQSSVIITTEQIQRKMHFLQVHHFVL